MMRLCLSKTASVSECKSCIIATISSFLDLDALIDFWSSVLRSFSLFNSSSRTRASSRSLVRSLVLASYLTVDSGRVDSIHVIAIGLVLSVTKPTTMSVAKLRQLNSNGMLYGVRGSTAQSQGMTCGSRPEAMGLLSFLLLPEEAPLSVIVLFVLAVSSADATLLLRFLPLQTFSPPLLVGERDRVLLPLVDEFVRSKDAIVCKSAFDVLRSTHAVSASFS
mmetsp:Transcript_19895/g.47820  ORF Transcript_19895/g.47820 Transcript_19895/m.47820 type:complete len:221 (+) Transcript_19895:97-759(+)